MTCSMTFAIAKKKSRSPKRKSLKRKSPKRKSPKRKSPKRKSPKRKSPKRKSRSPKKSKSRSRKNTGCTLQTTSKYTKRGSPPYPANQCCGQVMVGNDGNSWQSRPDKTGVCHWYKR